MAAGNHNVPGNVNNPSGVVRAFDARQVAEFFGFLIDPTIGCVEMRLWGARFNFKTGFIEPSTMTSGNVLSGWYDRSDTLIADAQRLRDVSAYLTSNPVSRDLLSLSDNTLARAKTNTNDDDIVLLLNLFLDIDSVRKKGSISATDAELATALARRDAILEDFPQFQTSSVWGCSGNGGFILGRSAGFPNDEEHRRLWARVVDGMVLRYSDNVVEVGPQSKNPARVMPLPGTMKCKGSHRPERPYRMVSLAQECRDQGQQPRDVVPLDMRELADLLPDPAAGQPSRPAVVQVPGVGAAGLAPQVNGRGGANHHATGKLVAPPQGVYDPTWAEYHCRKLIFDPNFGRSVEGKRGHKDLLHAALTIYSDFGLTDETGFRLFEEWNLTMADPPEDDGQVRHKWEQARKKRPRPELTEYWKIGKDQRNKNGQPRRVVQLQVNEDGDDDEGNDGIIVITTQENAVIDQAVEAMGSLSEIFQRANQLVRVLRDVVPTKKFIRPPGSPRIALMPKPRLRELMSIAASWKAVTDGGKLKNAHPPSWCIDAMLVRGEWINIRHLEAVIETPVIRRNGSILDRPGWDPETTLLYEPEITFPPMPVGQPSLEEAKVAKDQLLEVVSEFPWVSDAHQAAWLAALLTPLARFAIDGPCPLFLFDANAPGSGKSLLCDLIAIVTTGRPMPRTAYPEGEDEMRKRITSIALSGDRLMLLDNIATNFGGSALDGMITARTWRDRILGRSEMSIELPLFTVWYGTGNNVALKGDALRRVLPCRLEAKEECPEERTEFIHERLIEWVTKERGRLVVACLTILAGYVQARMPGKLPPLGSFESWSDVVRSAVTWVTGIDPCSTRKELTATDTETNIRIALVEGWFQMDWEGTGKTVTQALQMLRENPNGNATLYTAAMEISRTEGLPSPVSLSKRLSRIKGRVVNGKILTSTPYQGTMIWRVIATPSVSGEHNSEGIHSRGDGGDRGVSSGTPRDEVVYYCPEGDLVDWREQPHDPNNPHEPNENDQNDQNEIPF